MPFHTQCLDEVLILCAIVFPSAYIYFLKPFVKAGGRVLLAENLCTIIVYGIITAAGVLAGRAGAPDILLFREGVEAWQLLIYPAAACAGIAIVYAEYIEAAIPVLKKSGRLPEMRGPSLYRGRFSAAETACNVLSIAAAASLEELVFRQFMMGGIFESLFATGDIFGSLSATGSNLESLSATGSLFESFSATGNLFESFSAMALLAVCLSALFYAVNHVYFGRFAVIQKLGSGMVFAAIYAVTGGDILACAICHTAQNLFLYFYTVCHERRREEV